MAQEHWGLLQLVAFLQTGSVGLGCSRVCSGWFSSASRGYRKVFGVLVEGGFDGIRSVDENIKKVR